jgi:MinD superfamily P-loop ATPase
MTSLLDVASERYERERREPPKSNPPPPALELECSVCGRCEHDCRCDAMDLQSRLRAKRR